MSTTTQDLADLKPIFERRAGKFCDGGTFNGIEYHYELASADGIWVCLFPHEDHTSEDIAEAKSEARNSRDVVSFSVKRVPKAWYAEEDFTPEQSNGLATEPAWVTTCRWVKEHHSAARMDRESGQRIPEKKRGGVLIDAFSAGMIIAVVDALGEAHRKNLFAMHVGVAIHLCMECYGKCGK